MDIHTYVRTYVPKIVSPTLSNLYEHEHTPPYFITVLQSTSSNEKPPNFKDVSFCLAFVYLTMSKVTQLLFMTTIQKSSFYIFKVLCM